MKRTRFWLAATAVVSLTACAVPSELTAPSAISADDALTLTAGFEPGFYRAFVQNGYETPNHLEPKRVLQGPFRVYLRTEDEAGRPIDQPTLAATEHTLIDSAPIWSGGVFGIVGVERGTETREKVSGWIKVKWSSAPATDRCGRSTVGVDGGFIEFNVSGACSCGLSTMVYPRLVRHELGHAMGYYHTDGVTDVMYGQPIAADACDVRPSDRERRHAKFAYGDSR